MATPKRMAKKQPEGGRVAECLAVLEAHTKLLAFVFGLCCVGILLVLAVWFPKPTAFQYMVFRSTLALAAAGVGGVIPGMIRLKFQPTTKLLIHAGGALALFVIVYFFAPANLNIQPDNSGIKQSNGVGNQAVMINNTGSVPIQVTATVNNYGLTKEQREEENKQLADMIFAKMQHADASQLVILKQKFKDVQERLADTEKSYKEKKQLLEKTETTLKQVKSQLPEAQIDNALADLQRGKTEAAEQTLDAVDDESGRVAALAAFRSGQLAEDRLNYEKALRNYKRAVALDKNNPDYLLAAGKMASKLGDYVQAQEWLARLLKIREVEGKNNLALASVQHNLAGLYKAQGRYEAAEPLYRRALEIRKKKLGKDHPDVAATLNNLAVLYESQGHYEEAEPLLKRALEIREKTLGKDHPDVAQSLNSLATLYYQQERYTEAEPLLQRALAIRETTLGKNHPDVAITLHSLALLYEERNRYSEAELLYKRDLEITEKTLGKDHPDMATTLNNLAGLYESQGKYAEAELLYQRCLAILRTKLPAGHPSIKTVQENYDVLKKNMAGQ